MSTNNTVLWNLNQTGQTERELKKIYIVFVVLQHKPNLFLKDYWDYFEIGGGEKERKKYLYV